MTTLTLGQTLRAWRHRLSPVEVGLGASRGTRRTPGLRREELAWLAGVSVDYVQRLEQDRAHPSLDVVNALARALRVTRDEADELARLAGHAPKAAGQVSHYLTPGVQRIMDRLVDVPFAVYDASWTLITANAVWKAVFGDADTASGRDRNIIWQHFTGSARHIVHADVINHERSLVADLRRTASHYPGDREVSRLISDLVAADDRFAELWRQPDIARHSGQRKTITGTVVGDLTLDCDVLTAHDVDIRVTVFTAAAGSDAAGKLDMLRVTGLQDLQAPARVTD